MKRVPQVLVLLATYNGEKFLEELLKSLLRQKHVDLKIVVRDDGSTDQTLSILKMYSSQIRLLDSDGKNVGPDANFRLLMKEAASIEYDYVAFCDQDDIWMPDKMIRAVQLLEATGKSHYSSKRLLFSDKLNTSREFPKRKVISNFKRAIFENVSAGCTTVVTYGHFLELLRLGCCELDGDYDQIINIISSALDKSYFDQESRIYYRLHDDNFIGIVKRSHHTFNLIDKQITKRLVLLRSLLPKIGTAMSPTNYQFAASLLLSRNFINRLIWVYRLPKMRQNFLDDFALKAFFILKGTQIDSY